jgi:hypothetical protein
LISAIFAGVKLDIVFSCDIYRDDFEWRANRLRKGTVCLDRLNNQAGVDSVWEQKKLEARKKLRNAAKSPASIARFVGLIL